MNGERVIDLRVGEKITLRVHVGKSPELGDVALTYPDVVLVGCQPAVEWQDNSLLDGLVPCGPARATLKCTLIMEPT